VKFGRVISEICLQTDRETDTQTRSSHAPYPLPAEQKPLRVNLSDDATLSYIRRRLIGSSRKYYSSENVMIQIQNVIKRQQTLTLSSLTTSSDALSSTSCRNLVL